MDNCDFLAGIVRLERSSDRISLEKRSETSFVETGLCLHKKQINNRDFPNFHINMLVPFLFFSSERENLFEPWQ